MSINDNHINVAKYRGPVTKCPHCSNATLPGPLQTFCKFCFTRGYIAQCLKCDGSGMISAKDPWGSNSDQGSTCDICGGAGCLPSPKPEEIPTPILGAQGPPVDEPSKEKKEEKESVVVAVA